MWVFTCTSTDLPQREIDVRLGDDREWAAAQFNGTLQTRPELRARNLREEPSDYVSIEERNAMPWLFPPGVTCRSQLPER